VAFRFVLPVLGLPMLAPRPELTRMLEELVVEYAITGIVIHSEFALAAAALECGRARGIPVLHTVHTFFWRAPAVLSPLAPIVRRVHTRVTGLSSEREYTASTPINNALREMTLRVALRADMVVSPSLHQAESLRAAGVPVVRALSNVSEAVGLDTEPGPGPLTLVWAGRFAPEKRIDVALGAMRIVRRQLGPGYVHLHVAGGSHRPEHDVTFHGRVATSRVSELITRSDAVLLTSLGFDNQPMIALEAFTRGTPVIVSDPVLGIEFGEAAILASGTDAAGLAATIIAAAADRDLLAAAGARALDYATSRQSGSHAAELKAALTAAAPRS